MMQKTPARFWKTALTAVCAVLLSVSSGCVHMPLEETVAEAESEPSASRQSQDEDAERIIAICLDFYENEAGENEAAALEPIRGLINRLGENGYPAVDSENQIDMTEPEQIVKFCETADAGEEARVTMIEVIGPGGFVKYDFHTKDKTVEVHKSYYEYEAGAMQRKAAGSYQAADWKYTRDGYLMFSGVWFSEEQYAFTLSEAEEYAAFRVQPLDETCRELNRRYLLPVGYERNNLFLADWSEDDFGELDFYDIYDMFHPEVNADYVPCAAKDGLGTGGAYRIEENEFEKVIMTHFRIDRETLRAKTTYCPKEAAYEYRPRGLYEAEYPEYPYPEVTGYIKNSDGTLTLTVHAVFPYAGDSRAFVHEVIVRPLKGGGMQYVSNRVLWSGDDPERTWHTPRLSKEKWEEMYEDQEWRE